MIITEKVQVTIMYKNIEHYKSKGYKVKNLDKIEVPIEDIPTQSNIKIKVRCDYCGKEKYIKYQSYSKGTKFGKYKYACSTKCAWDKNRATNLERYGVEVVTQNKDVLNKCKNTILNKYGVDSISKTDYFKDKYKSTMKEKYGVENGFQLEEIKSKSRKTMIEKYGVEYNTQRETIKKQYLYGDKNYFYINGNGSSQEWNSPEAKRLKREIFKKYKRVCCICNKEKRKMNIHHIYSRNKFPDKIYEEGNLVVICKECHTEFHSIYGFGNNNKNQFDEFIQLKLKDATTIEKVSMDVSMDRTE